MQLSSWTRNCRAIASITLVFVCIGVISCDKSGRLPTTAASGYVPLPDSGLLESRESRDRVIASLKSSCRTYIRTYQSQHSLMPALAVAQKSVILESLESEVAWAQSPPVVWMANFGKRRDNGKPAIWVHVVSSNRETKEIEFLFGRPNGALIRVIYQRRLSVKDLEYDYVAFMPCILTTWDSLESRVTQQESESATLIVAEGSPVPIPQGDDIDRYVGVRDRNGKSSGFVPLFHQDQ